MRYPCIARIQFCCLRNPRVLSVRTPVQATLRGLGKGREGARVYFPARYSRENLHLPLDILFPLWYMCHVQDDHPPSPAPPPSLNHPPVESIAESSFGFSPRVAEGMGQGGQRGTTPARKRSRRCERNERISPQLSPRVSLLMPSVVCARRRSLLFHVRNIATTL